MARTRGWCSAVCEDMPSISDKTESGLENTASYNTHSIIFPSVTYKYSTYQSNIKQL